jgi:hypothetical protein
MEGSQGGIPIEPERVRQGVDKVRADGLMPTIDAVRSKLDQPIPFGYSNVEVIGAGNYARSTFLPALSRTTVTLAAVADINGVAAVYPPLIPFEEVVNVTKASFAAMESARSGKVISL